MQSGAKTVIANTQHIMALQISMWDQGRIKPLGGPMPSLKGTLPSLPIFFHPILLFLSAIVNYKN